MNNTRNSIASFFSNNHRYISLDGSGFHSGKLKSIFEKANFNVGAFAVMGLLAYDYLTQSSLSNLDTETSKNLLSNGAIFLGLTAYKNRNILRKEQKEYIRALPKHNHKAIDTTGKDLSRANLSLNELSSLKDGKITAITIPIVFVPISYFILSYIYGTNGFIIHSAMTMGEAVSLYNRVDKLYKGHTGEKNGYVFCDQPPAKTVKAKNPLLSLGGLTNPAP